MPHFALAWQVWMTGWFKPRFSGDLMLHVSPKNLLLVPETERHHKVHKELNMILISLKSVLKLHNKILHWSRTSSKIEHKTGVVYLLSSTATQLHTEGANSCLMDLLQTCRISNSKAMMEMPCKNL